MKDEPILLAIRVLVFVDHDVLETGTVLFRHLRKLVEHIDGLEQQVVEVERVRFLQTFFIFVENIGGEFPGRIPRILHKVLRGLRRDSSRG